jgi:hypothetical protein
MNETNRVLLLKLRDVRDLFTFSASDNSIAPLLSIFLPVLGENEIKLQICLTAEIKRK